MTYQPHQAEDLALKVALPEPFKVLLGPLPVFTAQQMREQWEAGRRAGLEEAAKRTAEAEREDDAEGCGECGGTGRAKP